MESTAYPIFASPFAWLEEDNGPADLLPFLLIYGLSGLTVGVLVEKRAKNIGFDFKESVWTDYSEKPWLDKLLDDSGPYLGPVTGATIAVFLALGVSVWTDATNQPADSYFLIFVAALLLVTSVLAIPVSLYLLLAPENHRQSSGIGRERKKLEKELKSLKEEDEIERLKEEINQLKNKV